MEVMMIWYNSWVEMRSHGKLTSSDLSSPPPHHCNVLAWVTNFLIVTLQQSTQKLLSFFGGGCE